jgi:DNA-binding transcriptional MerR regulator
MPLVKVVLHSQQIGVNIKDIFAMMEESSEDSKSEMTSMSMLSMVLVTLSEEEVETLKTFSRNHAEDVKEGVPDIVAALFIINGMLQYDHTNSNSHWYLPILAVFGGKVFTDVFFTIASEFRLHWALIILLFPALICGILAFIGYAIKGIFSLGPPKRLLY